MPQENSNKSLRRRWSGCPPITLIRHRFHQRIIQYWNSIKVILRQLPLLAIIARLRLLVGKREDLRWHSRLLRRRWDPRTRRPRRRRKSNRPPRSILWESRLKMIRNLWVHRWEFVRLNQTRLFEPILESSRHHSSLESIHRQALAARIHRLLPWWVACKIRFRRPSTRSQTEVPPSTNKWAVSPQSTNSTRRQQQRRRTHQCHRRRSHLSLWHQKKHSRLSQQFRTRMVAMSPLAQPLITIQNSTTLFRFVRAVP